MSHRQEVRFICDRCREEAGAPTAEIVSSGTIGVPDGWLALWLEVTTRAPQHLCTHCHAMFRDDFMRRGMA